jgi:hypothetical protein
MTAVEKVGCSTPRGSPSSPFNQAILPHTLTCDLCVGHCLHNLFSLPAPTPTAEGLLVIFQPNLFTYYTPFSRPVTLHNYSPMTMGRTERSETLPFKLQVPGNNPEESVRRSEHGERSKSHNYLFTR